MKFTITIEKDRTSPNLPPPTPFVMEVEAANYSQALFTATNRMVKREGLD